MALSPLSVLSQLTILRLDSLSAITSQGLSYLSPLTGLTKIALHCQRFTEGGLSLLTTLSKLRSITLHSAFLLSNSTFSFLTQFRGLECLEITGINEYCKVDYKGFFLQLFSLFDFQGIKELRSLRLIRFSIDTRLGSKEITTLALLSHLRGMSLEKFRSLKLQTCHSICAGQKTDLYSEYSPNSQH